MLMLARFLAWGLSREAAHLLDRRGFPERATAIREKGDKLLMLGGLRRTSGLLAWTTSGSNATSGDSKTPIPAPSVSYPLNTSLPSSESSLSNANSSLDIKPAKPKPSKTKPSPARPHPLRCSQRLLSKRPLDKLRHVKLRRSKPRRNKKLPKNTHARRFKRIQYNLRGVVRLRFDISLYILFNVV
jgi:hypothetical protein